MNAILEGVQGLTLAGLNVLEWAGVLFLVVGSVYGCMRLVRREETQSPATTAPGKNPVATSGAGASAGRAESILVVDDDPDVLELHAKLISSLGYHVSQAVGGREAIETVKENPPDLIVMDLLMPDQDGIETFEAIQQIRPAQRAIVISGYAGPSMVNTIQSLGVRTYLVKPVARSILGKAIRDELDRAA